MSTVTTVVLLIEWYAIAYLIGTVIADVLTSRRLKREAKDRKIADLEFKVRLTEIDRDFYKSLYRSSCERQDRAWDRQLARMSSSYDH